MAESDGLAHIAEITLNDLAGMPAPRMAEHATAPGSYQLVPRLRERHVDPGKFLCIDVFISGYGEIGHSKLGIWPTSQLFDAEASRSRAGLKRHDGGLSWASNELPGGVLGGVIGFGGINPAKWERSTLYFDINQSRIPKIATEADWLGSPFAFRLKLKADAKPGHYTLPLAYTYFDGERWRSSTTHVEFVVTSWVQQNEFALQIIAASAAVVAVLATIVSAIASVLK